MSEFIGPLAVGIMFVVGGIVSLIGVRNKHPFFWERSRVYWRRQFWGDETMRLVYTIGSIVSIFFGSAIIFFTVRELMGF